MTTYTFLNREAARALYLALVPDPFYVTLEDRCGREPETAREAMFRYMDFALKEARDHGRLTLPPDNASGAAVWSRPLPDETAEKLAARKKTFILEQMGRGSLDAYARIVDFMAGQSGDAVPEDAWYLSILGIRPGCQGKGLGKILMMPVLEEIDRLNLPAYAESFTPENFGFYERLGFRPEKTVVEPLTASAYTILVRPPRASEGGSHGR